MRHYEIVIIVHPNQSAKMPDILKRYQDMVTEGKGKVHRLEDWGRKALAYPIHRAYKGHYALLNIECSQAVLAKLDHNFRFNDVIIRSLIIGQKKAITTLSIMMKNKDKKNDNRKK